MSGFVSQQSELCFFVRSFGYALLYIREEEKMNKKIVVFFTLCILFCLFGFNNVYADTYGDGKRAVRKGLYSEDVYIHWYYNSKILVFGGSGTVGVSDFITSFNGAKEIVFEEGIDEIQSISVCLDRFDSSNLSQIIVKPGNKNYVSEDGVLYNKEKTLLIKYPRAKTSSEFVIPSTVKTLEYGAFENCSNLIKVTLPDGIGGYGGEFVNCENLSQILCLGEVFINGFEDTAYYNDSKNWENDMLYLGNTLIGVRNRYYDEIDEWNGGVYSIKDGTKYIMTSFYDASMMPHNETIIIPESVEKTLTYRWADGNGRCHTSLGPKGMSCGIQYSWKNEIPEQMFSDCEIKSIFITKDIKTIGKDNFGRGLTDIYYEGSETEWKSIIIGEGNCFEFAQIHYNYDFKKPTIETFVEDFETVFLTAVNIPEKAQVLLAGYDDEGKLMLLDTITLINGYYACDYDLKDIFSLKAMIWDNNMSPLCMFKSTDVYKY